MRVLFKCILLAVAGLLIVALGLLLMYVNPAGPFGHDVVETMYVPDYPNARNLEVPVQEDLKTLNWTEDKPYKVVTFVTTDSPDQVFAFYVDKLLNRPFEDWRSNTIEQGPASFSIIGFGRERISPPMYTFIVTTEQKQGLTYVKVERHFFPGM
ncbi:MAG: hypothetical protein ABJA50_04860 [Chloroflexota bacterium]